MTAQEARKLASQAPKPQIPAHIVDAIKDAASKGFHSIVLENPAYRYETNKLLEQQGYTVKEWSQYNNSYVRISWAEATADESEEF